VKHLIVTGDDFGLSLAVNEAIERAHRIGILSTASLMVGAPAAADAVSRAKRLPELRVGLHVVLVRGHAVLPAAVIPDLVDSAGDFSDHLAAAGCRYFLLPQVRSQLAREIRAQFEAFAATGLALDHANAHCHMHLHPTVLGQMLSIGPKYGLRAVRLTNQPPIASWRAAGGLLGTRLTWSCVTALWTSLMRARLVRAGINCNDYLFGVAESGRMSVEAVLGYIAHLPDGVSEMYFHPGAGRASLDDGDTDDVELAVLTDRRVRAAVDAKGLVPIGFADLAVPTAASPS
jgi:hopanoid biosynthesis associated protein HpnK